ncbi:MAG: hypothetical protein JWQ38_2864 [Flavipsychrobacter sp.]|nr:hypothetical protein [Flavipsychrobacter sp.]
MGTISLKYKELPADSKKYGEGFSFQSLSKQDFESFNSGMLGLGNLSIDGKYINALAVFLDLKGFTDFCNQVDSHLVIPEFLKNYTDWIFKEIADGFKEGKYDDHVKIWGSLPFYVKFLGDGLLFLWDTDNCGGTNGIRNIAGKLLFVTESYVKNFLPHIQKFISKPPSLLRCGIARGQIISIGNGEDFVGSCINMAARLQKISMLTYSISRRGFDLSQSKEHHLHDTLILKKVSIRGVGDDEIIYVKKIEFDNLPNEEKAFFRD